MPITPLRPTHGGTPVSLQLQVTRAELDIPRQTQRIKERFRKLFNLRLGEQIFYLEPQFNTSIILYFRVADIPEDAAPFLLVDSNTFSKANEIQIQNAQQRVPVFIDAEPILSLDINGSLTMTLEKRDATVDVQALVFETACTYTQKLEGLSAITWHEFCNIFQTNLRILCHKAKDKDLAFLTRGNYWNPLIHEIQAGL